MKTPDEVRSKLKQHLEKHWKKYLLEDVFDEPFEGISFNLAYKKEQAISNIDAFERYEYSWNRALEGLDNDGVELTTKNVNWGAAGGLRTVLKGIVFYNLKTAIEFAGGREFLDLRNRYRDRLITLKEEGRNREFISRMAQETSLLGAEKDLGFKRLITLVDFLAGHQNLDCYIREIPAPGIDTKFFEKYKSTVVDLLSIQMGKTVQTDDLKAVWKIKELPFSVEVRHAHNFIDGIPKELPVGLPLESLAGKPRALVIIENRQTWLSVKGIPDDVPIIMGKGFSVVRLTSIPWVRNVPIFYFGDLDHHGLQILSSFREKAHQTKSVLMNLDTLKKNLDFAVSDPTEPKVKHSVISLTEEEAELYSFLVEKRLRLEQERIPLEAINETFAAAFETQKV